MMMNSLSFRTPRGPEKLAPAKAGPGRLSRMKFPSFFFWLMGTGLLCAVSAPGSLWADASAAGADPEFGGQILTLTEPKVKVGKSHNPRYRDNQDGTVLDIQAQLVWAKEDSYQRAREWINWLDAQDYIRKTNEARFGGATGWRLPTRQELAGLYDENSSIPWNYYWTKNQVHIDPVFGSSHCCYWSGDEYKNKAMAWGFNFIRGKAYLSMKGGIQKSLTVIRPVRNLTDAERAEAQMLLKEIGKTAKRP
ncbi:MAG: DUF1566 domain-containing protein [Nitrospinaceae bacterium]